MRTPSQQLSELRGALLDLHKALIEAERMRYEETSGPVPSPNHFLHLLTSDPHFAWLLPLSQLIVAMDEALDGKEPLSAETAASLINEARSMVVPSEDGEGSSRRYFELLQRSPDVVLAHAKVTSLLRAP
ncbi:MAG TPA: hypothetical protein VLE43_01945 [Candidatus Saccharimonadia bacterium]|nr:hypothetical protein [Candidatus Saccharimonadia bacterium]